MMMQAVKIGRMSAQNLHFHINATQRIPTFNAFTRMNKSNNTTKRFVSSTRPSFITTASSTPLPQNTNAPTKNTTWKIKMLYDSECPLCMREVDMLKRRDEGKGKIAFIDIASPSYNPELNSNITFEMAMEKIHAIENDGTVISGVQVFRRLYEEVGLGWIYAAIKIESVGNFLEHIYNIWAKYRLPLTGRPDLDVLLSEKKEASCRVYGAVASSSSSSSKVA